MEARILNQGMPGYQDYFPPALGGLLAISKGSDYQVEQFYSRELADQMNHHLTLIYSGHSRNSGPNNWKIYKDFFDGDKKTISALIELAKNSDRARKSLLKKDYSGFLQNIFHEARIRREFFPDLYDEKTLDFYNDAKKIFGSDFEIKICGAGGGGCFAVLGDINRGKLEDLVSKYSMQILNGDMVAPVQEEKI
jgi:galactokinase/mevalonate kinase-like predicted kinase